MEFIYSELRIKIELYVDHRSEGFPTGYCKRLKRRNLKKFRLERKSNPWPLRYRCSALTNWAIKPTGSWSIDCDDFTAMIFSLQSSCLQSLIGHLKKTEMRELKLRGCVTVRDSRIKATSVHGLVLDGKFSILLPLLHDREARICYTRLYYTHLCKLLNVLDRY